jgi:hypothetical protein
MQENATEKAPAAVLDAGLDAAVADTAAGLAKETPPAAPVGDAWRQEPAANFEQDQAGAVLLFNGSPRRRGGRPRKPRAGDTLAGAKTVDAQAAAPPAAGIVDPDVTAGSNAINGDAGPGPAGEPLGPEAADVLTDAIFTAAEAVGGAKAKPKPKEAEAIKAHARATLGTWHVWQPLALVIFIGLWMGRVWIEHKQKGGAAGDPSHPDPRANADRKVNPGPVPRFDYRF